MTAKDACLRLFSLVAAFIVLGAPSCPPASANGLREDEYGALVIAFRQELSGLNERVTRPMCFRLPGGARKPKHLLEYLRSAGVPVDEDVACHPPKDFPRGIDIEVQKVRRTQQGELFLSIQTADMTLGPEVHFGTILKLGTYHLKRDQSKWTIVSYSDDRENKRP